ncbi:MAG: hypothetical protein R3250_03690 [Melioribacteraceae bacterium]|nr:hypothetical protein [Melioribacteraceae bacterium]
MKNLIVLLALILFATACHNDILQPEYSDLPELNKENVVGEEASSPRKSYKNLQMTSEYRFNPDNPADKVGGFLNAKRAKYSYEHPGERTIRNLKVYSPSTLVIDGKVYKTFNVYTINRHESLSKKGKVFSGNTWGSFKIHLAKEPVIFDEDKNVKYNLTAENSLKDLGEVLLQGKFSGNINGRKTKITLTGSGANILEGGKLSATEVMNCDGDFCWKSKISGKIKKVELKDE